MSRRIAVFASGGGSNLQALLRHFNESDAGAPARVALVVSDRAQAGALDRARDAGVDTCVVPAARRTETEVAADTLAALLAAGIELVALAGYLRRVPVEVVRNFPGRMLNVHPALLPAFGGKGMYGMHVHRAVLAAGCRVSGPTVHYVDEEYDTGRILLQWPVPVLPGDSPESLAARVLAVEHRVYPLAVEAVARQHDGVHGAPRAPAAGETHVSPGFGLSEDAVPDAGEVRSILGLS